MLREQSMVLLRGNSWRTQYSVLKELNFLNRREATEVFKTKHWHMLDFCSGKIVHTTKGSGGQ